MIVAIVACSAAIAAQAGSELSGTWTIDRGGAPAGRGAGGIAGIPIANTMIIKLSPNDVTMETDTGSGQSMQSFVYKLDGSSNPVPGALGMGDQGHRCVARREPRGDDAALDDRAHRTDGRRGERRLQCRWRHPDDRPIDGQGHAEIDLQERSSRMSASRMHDCPLPLDWLPRSRS